MKKLVLFLSVLLFSYNAHAEEIILPDCEDEYLIEKVVDAVKQFQATQEAESVVEKRRQKLILKNLEKFKEVPHKGFTSAQDFITANQLLMTKINKSLDDKDILLCQSDTEGLAAKVFLVIYHHNGEYVADVTNILPEGKILSIVY